MATFNNGESLASVRTKINDAIDKIDGNATISNDITFGDNDKAIFGAGSDLQIYHDGSNSFISDQGTGNLKVLADDFRIRNAADTDSYIYINSGAEVGLTYSGATKLATTSTGISVTGDATFADNGKAIFGAGSDLQIYHDGSNSYIDEQGTGNLFIRGTNHVYLQNSAGTKTYFAGNDPSGWVRLYHDNNKKFETTSTGVDISGTLTSDGLTVDGDVELNNTSASSGGKIYLDGTTASAGDDVWDLQFRNTVSGVATDENAGSIRVEATNARRQYDMIFSRSNSGTQTDAMRIDFNGDITFYDSSGNASFVYDESAGSTFNENGDDKDFRVESNSNTHMLFVDGGNDKVGVGTSSVNGNLATKAINAAFDVDCNETTYGRVALQIQSADDVVNDVTSAIIFSKSGGRKLAGIAARQFNDADQGGLDFYTQPSSSGSAADLDLALQFANDGYMTTYSGAVFNESSENSDFRVESDSQTHMLFVDAGSDTIGIKTDSPDSNHPMTISGRGDRQLLLQSTGDSGYTQGALAIASGTTDNPGNRGQGVYLFNEGNERTWYMGTLYSNGTTLGIGTVTGTTLQSSAADASSAVMRLYSGSSGAVFNDQGDDRDFRVESDNNSSMFFVDASTDGVGIGTNAPQGVLQIRNTDDNADQNAATKSLIFHHQSNSYTADNYYAPLTWARANSNGGTSGVILAPQMNSTGQTIGFTVDVGAGNTSPLNRLYFGTSGTVFNETGRSDMDFRIESDTQTHMLFVDAGENHISINHDNPNAEFDVKGEQVLRGKTNNSGITQMADAGAYTTSTSSTDIFQIYGLSNNSAEITIIFTDGSYRNGSFIQKLYCSTDGSGSAVSQTNLLVENKSREANGTFPSHFTWTATPSGSYVVFAATADQTVSGAGTIYVHVNSIGAPGSKALEMLI